MKTHPKKKKKTKNWTQKKHLERVRRPVVVERLQTPMWLSAILFRKYFSICCQRYINICSIPPRTAIIVIKKTCWNEIELRDKLLKAKQQQTTPFGLLCWTTFYVVVGGLTILSQRKRHRVHEDWQRRLAALNVCDDDRRYFFVPADFCVFVALL